jgi:hypothetical protein
MAAPKGHKRYGGRTKGTPNKLTGDVRDAISQAFTDLGGAKYLVQVGTDNPSAFCKLLGMTLPKDVKLDVGETLEQLLLRAMK